MTLAEMLQAKLANWHPAGDGRHSWAESFPDAGWSVQLAADHTDTLGCLVWELSLTRTADAPADLTLKTWAGQIADRVGGLMEDLRMVEVDDTRDEAILRSDEPTTRGDIVQYYEVRLTGLTHAVVRRFHANRAIGTRREQVAFALTYEVLAKFAGDIAG